MAAYFGGDYGKRGLMPLVGDVSQLAGMKKCQLLDENGFGFYVKYKKEQLPQFIEWKMMGEGI